MRPGLSLRMAIGLVVGLVLGVAAHLAFGDSPALDRFVKNVTEPGGRIFLQLLFMLVIPLILSALALGVAGLGDLRQLGRIGFRTFAYTVVVSTIAVLIGVGLVNLVKPGEGLPPELKEKISRRPAAAASPAAPAPGSPSPSASSPSAPSPSAGSAPATPVPSAPSVPAAPAAGTTGVDFLVKLVPGNIIKAMGDGDMLAVMVFSLFLGVGLALTRTEPARRFQEALEGLYDVVMRLLGIVIQVAPIGVACLLFTLTARLGYEVLLQLGAYVLVVIAALLVQQFVVYSASVAWLGGMNPLHFFRAIRESMLTAFSTASSNATLPTSLHVAEHNLKLPSHVSRFVLTIGSTANQNGTALFEGVTVLFLAQLYGIDLAFSQQLTVVFICILGGIGTAGVPAGSIPVVIMIMGMVGIPAEGIGLILGVDRFLDMCRTTINVTGDLAAAVVVARSEHAQAEPGTAPARPFPARGKPA